MLCHIFSSFIFFSVLPCFLNFLLFVFPNLLKFKRTSQKEITLSVELVDLISQTLSLFVYIKYSDNQMLDQYLISKFMAIFTLSGLSQLIKHRVSFPVLFMVMLVFIVAVYFGYHNRNKVCSNMVFMFKVIFLF